MPRDSFQPCFYSSGVKLLWILWNFRETGHSRIFYLQYIAFIVRLTAQKMKFSIKDFSSKCDQIRRKLRIWSHLLEKFLMENFIFCAVHCANVTFLYAKGVTE